MRIIAQDGKGVAQFNEFCSLIIVEPSSTIDNDAGAYRLYAINSLNNDRFKLGTFKDEDTALYVMRVIIKLKSMIELSNAKQTETLGLLVCAAGECITNVFTISNKFDSTSFMPYYGTVQVPLDGVIVDYEAEYWRFN